MNVIVACGHGYEPIDGTSPLGETLAARLGSSWFAPAEPYRFIAAERFP